MKTYPKISLITHQFWKPQKFSKTLKPKFPNMKCMKNKRLEIYQEKKILKKLEKPQRKRFGVREIVFGRWTSADRSRDIEEWEPDREEWIYRSLVNLDRCRYREVSRQLSRKVSRKCSSTDTGIEEVSRNNPSNARIEARSIHQLSRSYRGGRSFLDLSTRYQDSKIIEKVSASFSKQFFEKRKT